MKKTLSALVCLGIFFSANAQTTDLPAPTANLQTLSSGSYVIAMDNSLQANSAGDFNLKAYGLIVYLLNHNVRVKWCIKAGKTKDGTDFTGVAEQVKPTLLAGGLSRNFKAGPFIIDVADTVGVSALTDAFYTANSLTGLNRPKLYRLTADATNVDIRYDLTGYLPKAAILTDGGNQNIHLAYMTAAAIPSESYATSTGVNLADDCFTFASEPHNNKTGTAVNNAITAIRDFVTKGGNFLAQCEAVDNYENNSLGRFQTTSGITISNTNLGTTLNYGNPDLSFSQYEGAYDVNAGGSVKNWKITGSAANQEHAHVTGSGTNSNIIGASVSKLYYNKGGMVFYIGNHSFATNVPEEINGIRMYMNAFLTPSNTNCPELTSTVLDIRLLNFSVSTLNKKNTVTWTIAENEWVDHFDLERSLNGRDFYRCNQVSSTNKSGAISYQLSDQQPAKKLSYRLKIVDKLGKVQYSDIISSNSAINSPEQVVVLNNPVRGDLILCYFTNKNTAIELHVYNDMGIRIYSSNLLCTEGKNRLAVPERFLKEKTIYHIELIDATSQRLTSKAIRF